MAAQGKINYIRHLNAFYVQVRKDDRLKSSHISLYLALFQRWNTCQFRQAFPVLREHMMRLSRIGSRNTYTQCLKDLDAFGYIRYRPGGKDHPLTVISIAYLFEPAAPAVDERQLSLFSDLPPVSSRNFNTGVTRPKIEPVPSIKNEPPPAQKWDTIINI